jgi:hypothetical protein
MAVIAPWNLDPTRLLSRRELATVLREMRVRVVQSGFCTKSIVVVTTLIDAQQTTKEDLATLYRARWNNELDLRSIKSTMQMRDLRCKTPGIGTQGDLDTHPGLQPHSHADGTGCGETRYGAMVDQLQGRQTLEAFQPLLNPPLKAKA